MQQIEGFTPDMLWTFCIVLVGLAAIVVLFAKVADIIRDTRKRHQAPSDGVESRLEAIELRLGEIDKKLDRDKRRLDEMEKGAQDSQDGFKVVCTAVLALLNHEIHNGNTDEMLDAQKGIQEYLMDHR